MEEITVACAVGGVRKQDGQSVGAPVILDTGHPVVATPSSQTRQVCLDFSSSSGRPIYRQIHRYKVKNTQLGLSLSTVQALP